MAKTGIQVWQFKSDYGQGNVSDIDTQIPMSFAFVKTNWSTHWMLGADIKPAAESLADVAYLKTTYGLQGIGFCPWGEPHGASGAYAEGLMAGQIAKTCWGGYMLDLEDGPEFWTGGSNEVQTWLQGFRNGGGNELWLEPDAREGHVSGIALDAWLADPIVTRIWPQTYWPDFYPHSTDITRVDRAFHDTLAPLISRGVNPAYIFPVIVMDDRTTRPEWERALDIMRKEQLGGFMIWRRGTVTQAALDYITSLPDNQMPGYRPPQPDPAPSLRNLIAATREFALAQVTTLDKALAIIDGTGK